ncbi:MAG: sugar transferase [Chitinispirillaceae bacterium]|nr:sugar transferase [Chitinispirillaceae bacterium]
MFKKTRAGRQNGIVSIKIVDALTDEEWGLYIQSYFRNMLNFEIRRTERSQKPFLLVLVTINEAIINSIDRKTLERFRETLENMTRETDIKGWYRENKTVGIIYTDMSTQNRQLILRKVKDGLKKIFGHDIPNHAYINTFLYPEDLGKEGTPDSIDALDALPDTTHPSTPTLFAKAVKRAIDITGSIAGCIIFLPFFLLIPILIKCTSKGPVFFAQKRVGYNGKIFYMLKFRSMLVNNDPSLHKKFMQDYIKNQGSANADTKVFKIVNDPRVTPFGRLIRKTSLDELPQFFNVLAGTMSLVGPRPAIPYETEEYDAWHKRRFVHIKPGITGFWQVYGRSITAFDSMVRMDIHYIRTWNLFMDLKLLFKTPVALLTVKGAY